MSFFLHSKGRFRALGVIFETPASRPFRRDAVLPPRRASRLAVSQRDSPLAGQTSTKPRSCRAAGCCATSITASSGRTPCLTTCSPTTQRTSARSLVAGPGVASMTRACTCASSVVSMGKVIANGSRVCMAIRDIRIHQADRSCVTAITPSASSRFPDGRGRRDRRLRERGERRVRWAAHPSPTRWADECFRERRSLSSKAVHVKPLFLRRIERVARSRCTGLRAVPFPPARSTLRRTRTSASTRSVRRLSSAIRVRHHVNRPPPDACNLRARRGCLRVDASAQRAARGVVITSGLPASCGLCSTRTSIRAA